MLSLCTETSWRGHRTSHLISPEPLNSGADIRYVLQNSVCYLVYAWVLLRLSGVLAQKADVMAALWNCILEAPSPIVGLVTAFHHRECFLLLPVLLGKYRDRRFKCATTVSFPVSVFLQFFSPSISFLVI